MAKRGRPPKEKKGYFYEKEETAIINYINETNVAKKNIIFNTVLYPALTTMIESIMRRYKLYVPDEDFYQNFSDTISYLLTKIDHFRPVITAYNEIVEEDEIAKHNFTPMPHDEYKKKSRMASPEDPEYIIVQTETINSKGVKVTTKYYKKQTHYYKAYSYCGTVCKNYLMAKSTQYAKNKKRNTSFEEELENINDNINYSSEDDTREENVAEYLAKTITNEIERMINNPEDNLLTEDEIKVGRALITLFRNWEEVLPNEGSCKLQKSSVLYFLREETMMTTKEVRDNMKKYKCVYKLLKKVATE